MGTSGRTYALRILIISIIMDCLLRVLMSPSDGLGTVTSVRNAALQKKFSKIILRLDELELQERDGKYQKSEL